MTSQASVREKKRTQGSTALQSDDKNVETSGSMKGKLLFNSLALLSEQSKSAVNDSYDIGTLLSLPN